MGSIRCLPSLVVGYLLAEVEDTRVAAFGNFPLHFELEVLELVREDQVAAVAVLGSTARPNR